MGSKLFKSICFFRKYSDHNLMKNLSENNTYDVMDLTGKVALIVVNNT